MKKFLGAALLLVLATSCFSAVTITGDKNVASGKLVRLTADGVADSAKYRWKVTGTSTPDCVKLDNRLIFTGPAGSYKVSLLVIDFDKKDFAEVETVVTIGEPPDPGPTPGPTPDPGPTPGPAPIPTKGLRVLITYESADLAKLPSKQRVILDSKLLSDYLSANCVKEGKQPEFRIWDKDTDTSNASQVWKEAMKRERKSLPWILISNGTAGYEGPLPSTVDDTLALVKKYVTSARPDKKATLKGGKK